MKNKFLILLIILGLASFWRFYQLDRVPPNPSLDEVSIGWNAYSLLKTGKDEYGYSWPVLLRAYDDWRPALYVYLVIPFVKFLGLSATAVRLPAVLLSLITVLATYFLVKELFKKSPLAINYSLVASFFLAISPWHIYLSRLGHEVNAGLTFSVLGLLFFLKFFLPLSALFFVLSLYTYQSQKIFTPLLLLFLAIVFRKELLKRKKTVLVVGILTFFLLIPLFQTTLSPGGLIRIKSTSIFTNPGEDYYLAVGRVARDRLKHRFLGVFFDNQWLATGLYTLRAYFSHFNPEWLFFHKLEENHKVPALGLFYFWELPLILIGSYQLIKNNFPNKIKLIIFGWLFLGPLPAALATQTPHAMRAINILPIPPILAAIGVITVLRKISTKKASKVLIFGLLMIILIGSFSYFYQNYFFNFPYEQSGSFQFPLSQAVPYVLSIENKYDKILFSTKGQCTQSYMYFLFFSKTDPVWYQKQGGTRSGGFSETHAFGKYEFRSFDWNQETKKPATGETLYIGEILSAEPDFPSKLDGLKTFKLLDGREAIRVISR